jgi:EAL domain-containing protein (putative c-di-GMP-specific phosphodiesterase class I)
MGVQLSIDDFGTGYSMMQQLHYIPATELKIDKSFVQQMDRHELDRAMALKTIEIGRELGIKVIAEGVETAGQLDFLRASGCDLAQGHLFSRPLPANEMAEWLGQYGKSTSNFENDNSNLTGTIALASPSGYLPL